jgi:hypothetical protein
MFHLVTSGMQPTTRGDVVMLMTQRRPATAADAPSPVQVAAEQG